MNNPDRRRFLTVMGGFAAACVLSPGVAFAFSVSQARALIDKAIADINVIINSGKSEAVLLQDFEDIFENYGDSAMIGQLVLGADGRSASAAQKRAFAAAFQGYISRKYGRRFQEFAGGSVVVQKARAVKSFYEVTTVTTFPGQAPFEVIFVVADKSGRFIDMRIEGISLIKSERSEIGTMLDRRGGDLNRLINDLKDL